MSAADPDLAPPQAADAAARPPVERVTTLELFFDLVFVFTITQLTSELTAHLSWRSVAHVVIALGLIFWMYDGYAWLTNAVPAEGAGRQATLLGGMAGYLVLAIGIPRAFAGAGLTFGVAYIVIVVIHALLYVRFAGESSAAAMRALAPTNLLAAAVVLGGGIAGGVAQEVAWAAVFLWLWFGTRPGEFQIGPAHFVERHGLLVLVALGESVVATGIGARGLPLSPTLVIVVVLGLLLSAGLWWTYFGEGGEPVERAFAGARGAARVRMAFVGFGYAHYVMLLGIIFAAAGLRIAVAHPGAQLEAARAFELAGGTALFLGGDGWFRAVLGLRARRRREVGALAVLLAVPVAVFGSAAAALAVATGLVAGVVGLERRARRFGRCARRGGFPDR